MKSLGLGPSSAEHAPQAHHIRTESVLTRIGSATIHLTGQGQLLWAGVCLRHSFGRRFSLVSMVSINLGIWFYEVETCDTGEFD